VPAELLELIDCVYVAASTLDARLTRICVASVRRAHPDMVIKLLIGGRLQHGLADELSRYYGVRVADFPLREYGWGFSKLEPLFGPPGERFLMLDSDTVLAGPVLDAWGDSCAPFLVDNEEYEPQTIPSRYYDWNKVRHVDSKALPPEFVFNSGQWIGTSGILARSDFDAWVEWTFPRRLRHPECFFPGDQGILNYVLVQKVMREGLQVDRRRIMLWPGHGIGELTGGKISQGIAPPLIVHWAGMKKIRLSQMVGADILNFFEKLYYERVPNSAIRRRAAVIQNHFVQHAHQVSVRAKLSARKLLAPFS
jgi:hypothetical protein